MFTGVPTGNNPQIILIFNNHEGLKIITSSTHRSVISTTIILNIKYVILSSIINTTIVFINYNQYPIDNGYITYL